MRPDYLLRPHTPNKNMHFAARRQAASAGLAMLLTLGLGFMTGCAAPGEPSPRHPVVPQGIGDLAAHQQGQAVVLTFTLPKESVGKAPLPETPAIEIYRGARNPGDKGKVATRLIYRIPPEMVNGYLHDGKIEFRDTLEAASKPGQELDYAVRTRLLKKVASAESNVAAVSLVPAPAPPSSVHANITEPAIELTWTPPASDIYGAALSTPVAFRIYRAELEPGTQVPSDLSQAKLHAPLTLLGPAPTASFRDEHFTFGSTYLYVVRAVAEESGQSVESADSTPAVVTPKDVFPPATPNGMVAAIVAATNQEPAHVELSWSISPEPDLAGYWVYRSEDPGTLGQRLNSQALLSPAFRDMTAVTGKRYVYRVSAIDRSGNESPLSSPVSAEIPQQ
jgi:hypothetical protein